MYNGLTLFLQLKLESSQFPENRFYKFQSNQLIQLVINTYHIYKFTFHYPHVPPIRVSAPFCVRISIRLVISVITFSIVFEMLYLFRLGDIFAVCFLVYREWSFQLILLAKLQLNSFF